MDHRELFVNVRQEAKLCVQAQGGSQLSECSDSTIGDFVFHAWPAIVRSCRDMQGNVSELLKRILHSFATDSVL